MSTFRRRLMGTGKKELPNYLCFTALESGTFTFTIFANLPTGYCTYVAYSINDDKHWVRLDNVNNQNVSFTTPTVNEGDKVYWKGKGTRLIGAVNTNNDNGVRFSSTCRFNASGELSSLCTEKAERETVARMRAYGNIFGNCSTLIDASELILPNFTSNGSGVFYGLFYNCTNLVGAPVLDNEILTSSCYGEMYRGCTSLITTSSLDVTNLVDYCYYRMYYGCTGLTTIKNLPATNIPASAYESMFQGCVSLVNVPDIYIYQFSGNIAMRCMFSGCTSLVHCPFKSMPSTLTDGCMRELFYNCTSLLDICELPALTMTSQCYYGMLRNTKVTWIKMLATNISASNALAAWVRGISATGIFVKNIDATWTNVGESGVPSGWTIIYYDPALDKYYLDQQREIECDKYGNPIYQSIYVNNGLVFFLDAIKQNERGFSSWVDLSGNYQLSAKVESMSGTHSTFIDFYRYSMSFKNEQGAKFIGNISSGFTIEAIYQPKYTNYDDTIQDTARSGAQSMLVGFSNSEYFLQANGQLKLPGGSNIGTDVFDNSKIMHITWTYDGSSFKRYVDGVNDIDVVGTLNTSGLANVFILGYSDWGWHTRLCMNNIRIYSRALTPAEITSNYNIDITRFGTENVL